MTELGVFLVALNSAAALAEQSLPVITGPLSFVITVTPLAVRERHGRVMPMPRHSPGVVSGVCCGVPPENPVVCTVNQPLGRGTGTV